MRISDWSSDVCSSDLHRERRRDEADHRITAASWNRAVASLDRLYRWGEQQGLIADAPFSRRAVWQPVQGGGRGMIAARNDAYERVARRSDVGSSRCQTLPFSARSGPKSTRLKYSH